MTQQPPQPPQRDAAELARRRRQEQLETHFGCRFEAGGSATAGWRSTFSDAYGRDEAVTRIRNVHDARRFLEAEAAAAVADRPMSRMAAAAGAAASVAAAAAARADLKRSSWLPILEVGTGVPHHWSRSIYRQDFSLEMYQRPYIQPPMKDSGLLPRISDGHSRLGSVTRSVHAGADAGRLSWQKAENDRAATAAGSLCFIGGSHTHGDNPADFRCGKGHSMNRTDYGEYGLAFYMKQTRFPHRTGKSLMGVAATFDFGRNPAD